MYSILRIYIHLKNYIKKKYFLAYMFLVIHISLNFALSNLKFCEAVDDISIEGTVSQSYVLSLNFNFMSKNGQVFNLFSEYFFLHFIKRELGPT